KMVWPSDVTRGRRGCDHLGTAQVALCISRPHAALEISIGRRDPYFTFFQQPHAQSDAGAASRRQRLGAGIEQGLPDTTLLRLLLHPGTSGGEIEIHSRRY